MSQLYDQIGIGYRQQRIPDPRIAHHITSSIGNAESVLNVGAGTGSYEPPGCKVIAVEPSLQMIRQRKQHGAVQAVAEALPFRDASFDAAMAVLTIHHWNNRSVGLQELCRVARGRVVILTFDPQQTAKFWLVRDYLPEIAELDYQSLPSLTEILHSTGKLTVQNVLIPADCTDGFLGAYWKRPEAYLQPVIRRSISVFAKLRQLDSRLRRLSHDIETGLWKERYSSLLDLTELDVGYRIITLEPDRNE